VHLGQPVPPLAPLATAPARTGKPPAREELEEMRIAHNAEVARGDDAAAQQDQAKIAQWLDRSVATSFSEGVELLGVRVTGGVEPRLEIWFKSKGDPTLGDASFNVRSSVEARESFSLIPPDPTDREMAFPSTIPTKLWRSGFVYETDVVLNHRIGRERYSGYWRSRDGGRPPARLDGQLQTSLALIE